MIRGAMSTGVQVRIPEYIEQAVANGAQYHIPLSALTNARCEVNALLATQEGYNIDHAAKRPNAALQLSDEQREACLTRDEWQQAIYRMMDLIKKHVSGDLPLWEAHYARIQHRFSQDEKWTLWLAYDIEVRRQAVCNHIDMSLFHAVIYDACRIAYEERALLASVQAQFSVAASSGASRTFSSPNRAQPYDSRSGAHGNRRNSDSQGQGSADVRRCLVCGDPKHSPLQCDAKALINGQPLVLHIVPGSGPKVNSRGRTIPPKRVDDQGREHCFHFNGQDGCNKTLYGDRRCSYGRHGCTYCKSTQHGAPGCHTFKK